MMNASGATSQLTSRSALLAYPYLIIIASNEGSSLVAFVGFPRLVSPTDDASDLNDS